jgi:hypothetical protein
VDRRADSEPLEYRIQWQYVALAVVFALGGLMLLWSGISGEGPQTESTSRRVRAVENVLGVRGTDILFGVFGLGLAGYVFYHVRVRKADEVQTLPPPEPRGWWLVPLPLERRAVARRAAVVGLIATVPFFVFVGGISLIGPFLGPKPIDLGGILCMFPSAGFTLALVLHFCACLFGRRLSLLGWLVVPCLFITLACATNALAGVLSHAGGNKGDAPIHDETIN